MGKFNFINTKIDGLYIIEPTVFKDNRGYFLETYNQKEFFDAGLKMQFVQDNQSQSTKGVLRGLHFQKKAPQGKLVRVISGQVYDVAVDIRNGSKTYGMWVGVLLSEENKLQFYIPEGFAHGFLVISDKAEFVYKCSNFYDPTDEGGIMYNHKKLNINWNKYYDGEFILSEKDLHNHTFDETEMKF